MTDLNLQKISLVIGIFALIVAIICGILSIFSQVVSPFLPLWVINPEETPVISEKRNITLHTFDRDNGIPIPRARVLLFFEDRRFIGETDSTGTAQFRFSDAGKSIQIDYVVEADNYNIERQNNIHFRSGKIDVSLQKSEGDEASIIVLVTAENGEAVSNAEVVLLIEGTINPQLTDSNGIVKFPVTFAEEKVDAQVRVSAKGFQSEYQNVTLLPNRVLGIRLNSNSQSIESIDVFSPSVSQIPSPMPKASPTFVISSLKTPTSAPLSNVPTVVSSPTPFVSFVAASVTINEGGCDTLSWNVENVQEVYLDNQGVAGQGTLEVCPDETTVYKLRVVSPNGAEEVHTVLVSVIPKATSNFLSTATPLPNSDGCYHDDFSDPSSGWITGIHPEVEYSYSPSEYIITSKDANGYPTSFSVAPFGSFSQYRVKVDAKWAEFPLGDEYGIIFGIKGKDSQKVGSASSLYRFAINTGHNREFALKRYDGSRWSDIVGWTINSQVILGDTSPNSLLVLCYGPSVALYVNSNLIWYGDLPDSCSGEIGLTSSASSIDVSDPISNAHFDNFEICTEGVTNSNSEVKLYLRNHTGGDVSYTVQGIGTKPVPNTLGSDPFFWGSFPIGTYQVSWYKISQPSCKNYGTASYSVGETEPPPMLCY